MENTDIKKEYKLVFNSGIARTLLKMGVPIYDIKPDRNNTDKTVFVFKRTSGFELAFEKINNEIAESKNKKDE